MNRYIVQIEGVGFQEYEEVELPYPPEEGDPIETRIGTCIVTSYVDDPDRPPTVGKILCRRPT